MNFKEDDKGEEKIKIQTSLGGSRKFQSIKTRIRKLEKDFSELRSSINENKKPGLIIKDELATIKEKSNELCKYIMNDLTNFDKDLKRVIQNDRTKIDFFKVQIQKFIK